MRKLPILEFEPLLKELVWGGRKLASVLAKQLPPTGPFGESWEIVDLVSDQSVVRGGALSGTPLADLRGDEQQALLGRSALLEGRFPLLFKYIDAQQTLSVQVHPDPAACARIGQGARPKTEAWYIIDVEPGAVLYAGLKPAVTPQNFASAVEEGTVAELLCELEVGPGDFVFLPAGTIHAIGAGVLLAEVQQSSDTTYRVFDWNRVGLDGKPRQLHVEQALSSINFDFVGPPQGAPPPSGRPGIACDYFVMESLHLRPGESALCEGEGLLVLMGVQGEGAATLRSGDAVATVSCGQTRLVPACLAGQVEILADGALDLLAVRL